MELRNHSRVLHCMSGKEGVRYVDGEFDVADVAHNEAWVDGDESTLR